MSISHDLVAPPPAASDELDRIERHEVALLVGGRCRACAERLPGGHALRSEPCPLCHTPSTLDRHERDLLLRYLRQRGNVRVGLLATAIGVSHIVVGWFPVASTVVVALSAGWIRLQIVRPTARLLTPSRRRVAVWTGRLATSAIVGATLVVNELLTLIPAAGAVAKGVIAALQVLFVDWFNARYMHWQIARDEQQVPVAWWEYAVLASATIAIFGAAIGVVAAALAAVSAVNSLAGWLLG